MVLYFFIVISQNIISATNSTVSGVKVIFSYHKFYTPAKWNIYETKLTLRSMFPHSFFQSFKNLESRTKDEDLVVDNKIAWRLGE